MTSHDFWIVLTGALVASCCSLLGCLLMLRRMSLLGDAISHAVLPGIVIGYLLAGTRSSLLLLLGAALVGLLATLAIAWLHRRARVQSDAAIGIVFTALFAVGVILLSSLAGQVDLDQDCVLYGEIAYVNFDTVGIGGLTMGPRAVWVMGAVLVLILVFLLLFYKELLLTTFDPAYAATLGMGTALWHYSLMGMVSLTTVASFDYVGSILVVAFLVAPPATAYLLVQSLPRMLVLAVAVGCASALGGYVLAAWLDASIAGAMATVAGLLFVLAFGYAQWQKKYGARSAVQQAPS